MEKQKTNEEFKTLQATFLSDRDVPFHFWRTGTVNRHAHEYYEIFLITEGRVRHEWNGQEEILHKGMLALIKPKDVHAFFPFPDEPTVHFNTKISPSIFENLCKGVDPQLFSLLTAKEELICCPLKAHEWEYFFQTVQSVNCNPASASAKEGTPIIRALLFNFLTYLYTSLQASPPLYPKWLSEFLEELNTPENFYKPLAELYAESTYSQTRLNAYFHRYLGMTIVEYFTKQKLNYACNLLQSTNYTIAQIACNSGFNNLSNFNETFKKHIGFTPSAYRKQFNLTKL